MTALTVEIRGGLLRDLLRIAKTEGIPAPMLVVDACALLVQTYPAPVTFSTRTVKSTVPAGPGMTTTMASGAVGLWGVVPAEVSRSVVAAPPAATPEQIAYGTAAGGGRTAVKRGPGRPRKVRPDPDARCCICDHTRAEHCGEKDNCLSARCVCAVFRPYHLAEL